MILVIIVVGWSTLGSYLLTEIFHMFSEHTCLSLSLKSLGNNNIILSALLAGT